MMVEVVATCHLENSHPAKKRGDASPLIQKTFLEALKGQPLRFHWPDLGYVIMLEPIQSHMDEYNQ